MPKSLPSYGALKAHFPALDLQPLKQLIGGNINMGWVNNGCVIRVSRALNYAGHPIPKSYPGLSTAPGKDGKRYAFRVAEMQRYMTETYGKPDVHSSGGKQAFAGHQGIICFAVSGWSDATGHFDLWNGAKCEYHDYWDRAHDVMVWDAG